MQSSGTVPPATTPLPLRRRIPYRHPMNNALNPLDRPLRIDDLCAVLLSGFEPYLLEEKSVP